MVVCICSVGQPSTVKFVILQDFTIFLGEFSDPKLLNLSFEATIGKGF